MTWEDRVRDILQWICVWLTGLPCSVGESSSLDDLIADVLATHAANGCPKGNDTVAQDKLADLWELIHDAESTLTTAQTTALEEMITECYKNAGGNAESLP